MKLSYQQQGTGLPIVLIHGLGLGGCAWRYQLDEFGDSYRVVAVDLPGYGDSEPLPHPTIAGYAQALYNFLMAEKMDRPILVGHSLGGMIVQEFLATWPGRAVAVVLYGTSPAFGPREGAWQQQFIRSLLAPLDAGQTMREIAPSVVAKMVGPAAQPAGVDLATRCMAAVAEETFHAGVLSLLDFDQRKNLGQIDVPTLLIVGGEDTNAPPAMMEKMASKIPAASYVCLPGLGHLAHVENPKVFNEALHAFLTTVAPV